MLERFCIPATVTLKGKKLSPDEAEQSQDWGKPLAFRLGALFFGMFAFVGTSASLNRQAKVGLSGLIGKLKEGRSTLRIAYRAHGEPQAALEARTKKLKHMVAELWRQVDGGYPLDIEIETIRTVGLPLTTCPAY